MPNQSKVMLIMVLNLCKITESRKQKLKVEILHDLNNFEKNYLNVFCNNLGLNLFYFQKIASFR